MITQTLRYEVRRAQLAGLWNLTTGTFLLGLWLLYALLGKLLPHLPAAIFVSAYARANGWYLWYWAAAQVATGCWMLAYPWYRTGCFWITRLVALLGIVVFSHAAI